MRQTFGCHMGAALCPQTRMSSHCSRSHKSDLSLAIRVHVSQTLQHRLSPQARVVANTWMDRPSDTLVLGLTSCARFSPSRVEQGSAQNTITPCCSRNEPYWARPFAVAEVFSEGMLDVSTRSTSTSLRRSRAKHSALACVSVMRRWVLSRVPTRAR